MKDLKGTKTEQCLMEAFSGESKASMKYRFYASRAKKDGYVQIGKLFQETSDNEKEHAELWFKWLHGNAIPDTVANLLEAAAGEHYETTEMYPSFAKIAREEGFEDIAREFEGAGKVEAAHEARYNKLRENIEQGRVFEREEPAVWQCSNCGHLQRTKAAPNLCPVCQHSKAYFQLMEDNY